MLNYINNFFEAVLTLASTEFGSPHPQKPSKRNCEGTVISLPPAATLLPAAE